MLFFDPPLFNLLNASSHSPHWLIQAAKFSSAWLPSLCALPILAAMLAMGKGWRRSLKLALLSLACAWVACRLIRWGLPMPRPVQLGMGTQWISHSGRASFPSMHAAGAFALAQSVQLGATRQQKWLPPLVWFLAACVALSRIVLGVHFPSDILAGMLVGCFSAVLVWNLALKLARLRWQTRKNRATKNHKAPPLIPEGLD